VVLHSRNLGLLRILRPARAGFGHANSFDAHTNRNGITRVGTAIGPGETSVQFVENRLRHDLARRVLFFKRYDVHAVGLLEISELRIVGIEAKRMVPGIEKGLQRSLHGLEIAYHVVGIQSLGPEYNLHAAAVAVGKAAFIGVLGEQVPGLNFEAFTDAERHGGNSK